jgi:predicted N-acetyltransferase YhbS
MRHGQIEILPLADFPQAIRALAAWIHAEWGALEAIPQEEIEAGLRRNSGCRQIPTTFVALSSGKPVGTVSLDTTDLPGFDHLGPWLASLYVEPGSRGQGLGSRLLKHAMDHARSLGARPLWLWTIHNAAFFEKHGWKKSGETMLSGHRVHLMALG